MRYFIKYITSFRLVSGDIRGGERVTIVSRRSDIRGGERAGLLYYLSDPRL